jgi:hypothetical protein
MRQFQRHITRTLVLILALSLWGCSSTPDDDPTPAESMDAGTLPDVGTPNVDMGPDVNAPQRPEGPWIAHQFEDYTLGPFEERQPCVTWKLNNERALYVRGVTLYNEGAWHHSNWFVVPDDMFTGEDGYFKCSDRGFEELAAAIAGTVLYAQSTQAVLETQELPEGVVIKIPPNHRIVAGTHLLNLSAREVTTSGRMTLDLVHPKDVKTVVAPFRLGYWDLNIPASSESRHTGECPMSETYGQASGRAFDMKLYYVLPHYHALGNYFRLEIMGGPNDGEEIIEVSGFNAEANGVVFDPPIDLTGATGLRVTCGYNNNTNSDVGWGIGDQEMCEFLGLADTAVMMDGGVDVHNSEGTMVDGVLEFVSPCETLAVPKNAKQSLPEQEEIEAELYKPESSDEDRSLPPAETCKDSDPDTEPELPATLESIRENVFVSGCTFNACHGGAASAHGLDLTVNNLREMLVDQPSKMQPDLNLVTAGKPEESWLYHVISRCEPMAEDGVAPHMPLNAPELIEDPLVAKIRQWILDGATD